MTTLNIQYSPPPASKDFLLTQTVLSGKHSTIAGSYSGAQAGLRLTVVQNGLELTAILLLQTLGYRHGQHKCENSTISFVVLCFEIEPYVAQVASDSLCRQGSYELLILLTPPPKYWDYRHAWPCSVLCSQC